MRKFIIGLSVIGLVVVSYLGYTRPELFQASLTGGGVQNQSTKDFYIPNNYKALKTDMGSLEVRAGQDIPQLINFHVTFKSDPTKIEFTGIDKSAGLFANENVQSSVLSSAEIRVSLLPVNTLAIPKDTLLFKINFKLNAAEKDIIEISAYENDQTRSYIVQQFGSQGTKRPITFGNGKIEVIGQSNQNNVTGSILPTFAPIGTNVNNTNPLFATLIGGDSIDSSADAHLYISPKYADKAGAKGYIEVRTGKNLTAQGLEKLKVSIVYPKDQITLTGATQAGGVLANEKNPAIAAKAATDPKNAILEIDFGTLTKGYLLKKDDLLFKVSAEIAANLASGIKIPLTIDPAGTLFNMGAVNGTQFISGQIEVQNQVTPNPPSNLDKLAALILTLNQDTISKLTPEDKKTAYRTAYIMIHSSSVAGKTIRVASGLNGLISIPTASPAAITKYKGTDSEEVGAIRAIIEDPDGDGVKSDGLATQIGNQGIRVTTYSAVPGLMKLQTFGSQSLDMIQSTAGDMKIVPGIDYTIDLKSLSSYQLELVGINNDATFASINFNDVTWIPAKVDQLDATALLSGRLQKGKIGGAASLHVEAKNKLKIVIKSNTISVNVPEPADLAGILLTASADTLNALEAGEIRMAFKSAYLAIHHPDAAGKKIKLEGTDQTIPGPSATLNCATEKRTCVDSITTQLKAQLASAAVNVADTGIPGVLKLTASGSNASLMDQPGELSTTSGEVSLAPAIEYTLDLPFNRTYRLQLIGIDSESNRVNLTFNDVKWQPQPVNLVDKTSLDGGLLKRGDKTGTSSIYVEKENKSKQLVKSNQIAVKVASEPMIEYLRRIGANLVERGGQINLEAKVTDANAIADIKSIKASLVRSGATDYAGILKDKSATWFDTTHLNQLLKTVQTGTQNQTNATTTQENFRIYNFSLQIPQKAELTDGAYQLVVEITDLNARVAAAVLPIRIGAGGQGDVNGDGQVTMIDVITAFNIVNGTLTNPTGDQIKSADLNGDGQVTMIDVLNLFNKVSQ